MEKKGAISKVRKHIFHNLKNCKKSIFAPEKSPKIVFLGVLNFFAYAKIDIFFCHFEMAKNVFSYF